MKRKINDNVFLFAGIFLLIGGIIFIEQLFPFNFILIIFGGVITGAFVPKPTSSSPTQKLKKSHNYSNIVFNKFKGAYEVKNEFNKI